MPPQFDIPERDMTPLQRGRAIDLTTYTHEGIRYAQFNMRPEPLTPALPAVIEEASRALQAVPETPAPATPDSTVQPSLMVAHEKRGSANEITVTTGTVPTGGTEDDDEV